jgi:carbon monoxide dehydrogenase subunit G
VTVTVAIGLRRDFEVKAPFDEVFEVLSDVPVAARCFAGLETLTHLGDNVHRWEMQRIGIAHLSLRTVYAIATVANRSDGTVTATPIPGQGNAQVGGRWQLIRKPHATALTFDLQACLEVPLPGLMRGLVAPIVKSEFERLVQATLDNLIRRFGGLA